MNLFRFLVYAVGLAILVLVAALGAMISGLTSDVGLTEEIRSGLVVILVVIVFLLLLLRLFLCLARAKERLRKEKSLYRDAHGAEAELRKRAEEELAHFLSQRSELGRCSRICDTLVRRKFPRSCLRLPIDVTRRPDPCIYSQFFLMANGQSVTWDNPNVEILLGGLPQDTYNLAPATTYEVRVGIENASPVFDAIGTQVQVNLLTFGVGAPGPALIHSFVTDVPAATTFPGIPEPFAWTSPPTPGHYCIQVLITHPNDVNTGNNEGWNNTEVRDVHPGETFKRTIPVWNAIPYKPRRGKEGRDANFERLSRIDITVDSYEFRAADLGSGDLDVIFAPRPAVWGAGAAPLGLVIPPGGDDPAEVEFQVTVPDDAVPGTRATFNVTATAEGHPLGGVTFHLNVR